MKGTKTSRAARQRRHIRVRERVRGTAQRPRLAIFRSLNHIYAQIIDDGAGRTMAHASDTEKEVAAKRDSKKKSEVASFVGEAIARRAKEQGIKSVVFDRGGFRYHGRVKALAEAARKGGLQF